MSSIAEKLKYELRELLPVTLFFFVASIAVRYVEPRLCSCVSSALVELISSNRSSNSVCMP